MIRPRNMVICFELRLASLNELEFQRSRSPDCVGSMPSWTAARQHFARSALEDDQYPPWQHMYKPCPSTPGLL